MNWAHYLSDWETVAKEWGFKIERIAEVDGLPLISCEKGDRSRPTVYLSSGIHGDEPSGPQALLALLREGYFSDEFHWLICPALNPTGLQAGTRENSAGIDLNRDYLMCESPEVCAHLDWLKRHEVPDLFLSLHEDWESTGFYYYEINCGGEGAKYNDILAAASFYFPPEPEMVIDDHPVTEKGWIYHSEEPDIPEGWPEAIYLAKVGCPVSLTFETPSSAELANRMACHQAVVKEAVRKIRSSL
ncbi:M14 family metallocarboxypeptidase [Akkermansiaceae bacterium]|nr:M14 family metallocarboxypeptidase [Akkermansiaceae bacterium]MDB4537581.1 M14 family metallocarboxypeptidase [Akkermansiaceae bacterium]